MLTGTVTPIALALPLARESRQHVASIIRASHYHCTILPYLLRSRRVGVALPFICTDTIKTVGRKDYLEFSRVVHGQIVSFPVVFHGVLYMFIYH